VPQHGVNDHILTTNAAGKFEAFLKATENMLRLGDRPIQRE